eukprot:TRINITY_DN859_c0_g3_i1.p1 TRINITY_DN859_c0_g3~~TRINITY_DN859_c0_g3_i1.p1  ORF type:complete len:230 (-),score=79.78 TRINITY_DN859_c0_g3_i1:82-771(-)
MAISLGMKAIRKSIQTKAEFDINDLSPIKYASSCFSPSLFVHGEQDNFILPHHGQDIYEEYQGEKNIIMVNGGHNDPRPQFCNDSISIFFTNCLMLDNVDVGNDNNNVQNNMPGFDNINPYHGYANLMDMSQHLSPQQQEEQMIQQALLLSMQEQENENNVDENGLLLLNDNEIDENDNSIQIDIEEEEEGENNNNNNDNGNNKKDKSKKKKKDKSKNKKKDKKKSKPT